MAKSEVLKLGKYQEAIFSESCIIKTISYICKTCLVVLWVGTAHLVSFTSSSMLGGCCLTNRFPGLAINSLFCSLLDENKIRIQGCYPHPFPFVPQSLHMHSTTLFRLLSLCTLFCPLNTFPHSVSSCHGKGKRTFVSKASASSGAGATTIHFLTEITIIMIRYSWVVNKPF